MLFFALVPGASAAALLGLMNNGATKPLMGQDGPTISTEEWDVIKQSGASLYRMPISMKESKNGSDWSFYNTFFRLAAERGVTILPFLEGRANGQGGLPVGGSPSEKQEMLEWLSWVQEAVKKYGHSGSFWEGPNAPPYKPVNAWEILNEPNNAAFGAITPYEYGDYFASTANAIQVASEAKAGFKTDVLFGGLAIINGGGTKEIIDYKEYLALAYQIPGVRQMATGIGIHPYALEKPIGNPAGTATKTVGDARTFVNGGSVNDPTASLWVTEIGIAVTDPTHGFGEEHRVSEKEQAEFLTNTFNWLKSNATNLNIRSIIWYNYRDSDFEDKWPGRCGLRDEMGNFRRSWFAFLAQTGKTAWPVPRIAFQANTGNLWLHTRLGGGINTTLGMKAGTSPSIGQYKGGYRVAFQANTGTLWTADTKPPAVNTGYAMAAGTSPSVTTQEDGVIAFQSSSGNLSIYQDGVLTTTAEKVKAGTSPSVTVLPDRIWRHPAVYPVAYQTPTGELRIYESGNIIKTGLGMAPGTSPAIAGLDLDLAQAKGLNVGKGRFVVSFQADTGELWHYIPEGPTGPDGLGMKAGTSPSVTSLPNGRYAITFQANNGRLWHSVPGVTWPSETPYGMGAGTSPSVSALSDAPYYREFEAAFNSSGGSLWTFEPGGSVTNTLYGYQAGTSPSIGPS